MNKEPRSTQHVPITLKIQQNGADVDPTQLQPGDYSVHVTLNGVRAAAVYINCQPPYIGSNGTFVNFPGKTLLLSSTTITTPGDWPHLVEFPGSAFGPQSQDFAVSVTEPTNFSRMVAVQSADQIDVYDPSVWSALLVIAAPAANF